jgi:hypothetical protein
MGKVGFIGCRGVFVVAQFPDPWAPPLPGIGICSQFPAIARAMPVSLPAPTKRRLFNPAKHSTVAGCWMSKLPAPSFAVGGKNGAPLFRSPLPEHGCGIGAFPPTTCQAAYVHTFPAASPNTKAPRCAPPEAFAAHPLPNPPPALRTHGLASPRVTLACPTPRSSRPRAPLRSM